jgi:hypothetical protein
MKALLLADRLGTGLSPFTERTAVALLPVAGKPLVFHAIEDLVQAGVKEAVVVVSAFAEEMERVLGDGSRWGMKLDFVLSPGDESSVSMASRLGGRFPGELLAVRGDVLRSPLLPAFLARAAERSGESALFATAGGRPCGVSLVRDAASRPSALPTVPEREPSSAGVAIEIDGAVYEPVLSLADLHRANVEAVSRRIPGLLVPGREVAVGLVSGRRSRVPLRAVWQGPVFVGARCSVDAQAELLGPVVLSDDVVVDRRATLSNAVVLPHSYVGELVEVTNALVFSDLLVRVDTGTVTRVTDAFLLSDLRDAPVASAVGGALSRLAGLGLLALSLPLWPLALVASLVARPSAPFRRVTLGGARRERDETGAMGRKPFATLEGATAVPILKHLPRLLAVVAGNLALVGVSPLPPDEEAELGEEWAIGRREAPAGLLGPAQLLPDPRAPQEERLLADVFLAGSLRSGRPVSILKPALRALFSRAAWSARRGGDAEEGGES